MLFEITFVGTTKTVLHFLVLFASFSIGITSIYFLNVSTNHSIAALLIFVSWDNSIGQVLAAVGRSWQGLSVYSKSTQPVFSCCFSIFWIFMFFEGEITGRLVTNMIFCTLLLALIGTKAWKLFQNIGTFVQCVVLFVYQRSFSMNPSMVIELFQKLDY